MAAKNENEIAVSIPLEDVEKIEIYLNKSRKALSTIIREPTSKIKPKSSACHSNLYEERKMNHVQC